MRTRLGVNELTISDFYPLKVQHIFKCVGSKSNVQFQYELKVRLTFRCTGSKSNENSRRQTASDDTFTRKKLSR